MTEKKKTSKNFPILNVLLLITILLGISLYFFIKNYPVQNNNSYTKENREPTISYDNMNLTPTIDCNEQECANMGEAILKGYYSLYNGTDMDGAPVPCDSILVKEGTPEILQNFRVRIEKQGNGLNHINENNELMVSIDIESLSPELREKIINSNPNNLITLKVKRKVLKPMGVQACTTLIDILDVTE